MDARVPVTDYAEPLVLARAALTRAESKLARGPNPAACADLHELVLMALRAERLARAACGAPSAGASR